MKFLVTETVQYIVEADTAEQAQEIIRLHMLSNDTYNPICIDRYTGLYEVPDAGV